MRSTSAFDNPDRSANAIVSNAATTIISTGSPHGRLTVASTGGGAVDSRTIRTLLGDLSPQLLAELYALDFAEGPQAKSLLDGAFAREFTLALGHDGTTAAHGPVCREHATTAAGAQVGDKDRKEEDPPK